MGYLALTAALILNASANLLLKAGADRLRTGADVVSIHTLLANYPLLLGLALFALNIVFYVLALTRLDLSVAYPVMMAGGMLIVVAASVIVFREPLAPLQVVGILVLATGIVLVTFQGAA